jgi:predicted DCC family thiol-disulfide oxidoreductase YuxK
MDTDIHGLFGRVPTPSGRAAAAPAAKAAPIVLFDGVCNFCNSSIQFILRRDRSRAFRFAALQSEAGRRLLQQFRLPEDDLESMVLIEDGRAYHRSAAGLRIARRLGWAWPLLYGLIVLPPFLRDAVYNLIARNRYRWFGKQDQCMIPTPDVRDRFLA